MQRLLVTTCVLASAFSACTVLRGQETPTPPDKVTVAFSDPSRPGRLRVQLVQGGVTVRAYDGKDVTIEARVRDERSRRTDRTREGLRRLVNTATGLQVEEDNNDMRVSTQSFSRTVDLTIQVPRATSLKLGAVNSGDIVVEGVDGDIEVNNINGGVTLDGVAGAVVAHALNDDLKVRLTRVPSGKPMSFSSLNGDIDVTLPATTKATVKLETEHGEILTDFDVTLQNTPAKTVVESGASKGRYRVRVDKAMSGLINGGGPEFTFKTFNGDIRIRKAP